jgi:hypothetical protein
MNSRQRRARRAREQAAAGNEIATAETNEETTMTRELSYLIAPPPPPPKRVVTVLNGGAHRGARENIAAFAEFNLSSAATAIQPVYTDPLPGRALELKEEAARRGVVAGAIEGKVETIVKAIAGASSDPLVLNIDRASGIASVLRDTRGLNRAILGYLLVKLPDGGLRGIRYVLEPKDAEAREAAITFFETLAHVSERNTSDAIFGEHADPVHALLEPAIRRWFTEHTKANLAKIVAGLEPVSNVFEVTSNGHETLPLFVTIRRKWSDPLALAETVVANPSLPIRKGARFVIAEVLPGDGIRFHDVRRRTDDRVTVGGAEVVNLAAVREAVRREEVARQAAEARRRAEADTLSLRRPVWTTD